MNLNEQNLFGYQPGQNLFTLGLLLLLAPLSAVCWLLWPIHSTVIAAVALFSVLIFYRLKLAVFLVMVLVPVGANFEGFQYRASWSAESDLMPVFPWVVLITFLGVLMRKIARVRDFEIGSPAGFVAVFFFAWAAVSTLWAPNFNHTLFQSFLLLSNFLLFYLTATLLKDEELHRVTVKALIFWGIAIAAISMVSLHFLDETHQGKLLLTDSIVFKYSIKHSDTRAKALLTPNETALFLNIVLSFMLCYFFMVGGWLKKALFFLAMLFIVFGVLETKSKAGVGTMLIMVVALNFLIPPMKKEMFKNLALTFLTFITLFVLQNISASRMPRVLASEDLSLDARIAIWNNGMDQFLSMSSGWGLGVGGLVHYLDPLPHAHSIYLSVLYDLGVVGVVLAAAFVAVVFVKLLKRISFQMTYAQAMLIATLGSFIAIGVHGTVDFSYMNPLVWLFMGIATGTISLSEGNKKTRSDISP